MKPRERKSGALSFSWTSRYRLDAWCVFFGAIIMQLFAFDPLINLYDEGIILVGAERVLHGQIPYRDFWTMYGPGQYYLVSWLFSIFGTSDLVLRFYAFIVKAVITSISFLIMVRFASRTIALVASAVILGLVIAVRQDASPLFPALALALAAVLFVERGLKRGSLDFVIAGFFTGLATCFRHDLGAYNAAAIIVFLVLVHMLRNGHERFITAVFLAGANIARYSAGVLAVAGAVALMLFRAVPASDLYENLIYIPSRIYPAVRAIPFPGIEEFAAVNPLHPGSAAVFAVYVPFMVVLVILFCEMRHARATRIRDFFADDGRALILLVALTCLFFTLKGFVRATNTHMVQSLVLSVVLITTCVSRADWRNKGDRLFCLIGLLPAAVLVSIMSAGAFLAAAKGLKDTVLSGRILTGWRSAPPLPRMRCVSADEDYLRAARYVRDHSQADDSIYVGTTRHDKIHINAVAFYFMVERAPVTKWYELHPGVQTRVSVQREMIDVMRLTPPRFVILDSRWDHVMEPNRSRLSSGVTILDEYLLKHYHEVARFGTVMVMEPLSAQPGTWAR